MALLLKIFLLVAVIKLFIATEKPLLCAGVYAAFAFFLGPMLSEGVAMVGLMAGITFAAAFAYFWLRERFGGSSLVWWCVAVGIGVPLVFL